MTYQHPEILDMWYRNSFCFDYWQFLKSDIDITIILQKADKLLIADITQSHSLFRRFLPIIGELCLFSEFHKDALIKCANSFEIARDPILVLKYSLEREGDLAEKIVFLHKFISSNWFKPTIDSRRSSKVEFYSNMIGLKEKNFSSLVNTLAEFVNANPFQFQSDYRKEMEFNSLHKNFTFPNVIYCLFYNHLCYLKPETPLSKIEKKILEKILLWELWGCFSHQAFLSPLELEEHIQRMTDRLDELTDPIFAAVFIQLAKKLELMS